jgi:hypothetical protein
MAGAVISLSTRLSPLCHSSAQSLPYMLFTQRNRITFAFEPMLTVHVCIFVSHMHRLSRGHQRTTCLKSRAPARTWTRAFNLTLEHMLQNLHSLSRRRHLHHDNICHKHPSKERMLQVPDSTTLEGLSTSIFCVLASTLISSPFAIQSTGPKKICSLLHLSVYNFSLSG